MKYPEIVEQAREAAKQTEKPYVVYRNVEHNSYHCTTNEIFETLLGTTPVIRMLLCLPDGTVVQ